MIFAPLRFLLPLLVLLAASAAGARGPLAVSTRAPAGLEKEVAEITAFVEERMGEGPMAGLSMGFVHEGKAWAKGFGLRDVATKKHADAETSYRMASVTKIMTAVAVLQLVERGRMKLDADIRRYVPSFPRKKHKVTVRELLGHLGGIPHYKNCAKECHFKEEMSTEQALDVFKKWPLESEPGTEFHYTSYGYDLLGAAIEKVSGMSYRAYLQKHIFGPLGMKRSEVEDASKKVANKASGYRVRDDKLQPSEVVNISSRFAGGGTRSSASDMLRLGHALLRHRLLKTPTFEMMVTSMADAEGLLTDYGMGVATYPLAGRLVAGHAGAQPETSSLLLTYPGSDLVVAVVCNVENQWGLLYAIAAKVSETLLNQGIKRRGVTGVALGDDVEGRALTGVFGHGLAVFKHRRRTVHENVADLLDAFEQVNALLDPAYVARDPGAAYLEHKLGPGPKKRAAFTKVGAFMAAVLASSRGMESLERYHVAGPLPFFVDYAETCARIDCPDGLRLSSAVVSNARALNADWSRAYTDDIKRMEVPADVDLAALGASLKRAFGTSRVRPDFSAELIDVAERAKKAKDWERATAALTLGRELFGQNPKVAVALAQVYYQRGDLAAGDAAFADASKLLGAEDRLTPDRVKAAAAGFRREGNREAERAWLKAAADVHPEDTSILDMWARAAEKTKHLEEAKSALERAQGVSSSKRRARRIKRLQKALAKSQPKATDA